MTDDLSSTLNTDLSMPTNDSYTIDPVGYSVRRLNYLSNAINATNYLEIGVETGSTFLHVDCGRKTGVDPAFQFDWESHNGVNGVELLQATSDSFFQGLERDASYDLVFIDGLHTFEQTYRDVIHAMRHAHPRSIFLIDDTVPCDVFSTCRDQQECLSLRSTYHGAGDIRWHGDTYKIIPLLCIFNSDYEIATIIDNGNPQTLLWRAHNNNALSQLRTMQAMWAIQNLAAADYLWFLDNISLYNPLPEKAALDRVLDSINS